MVDSSYAEIEDVSLTYIRQMSMSMTPSHSLTRPKICFDKPIMDIILMNIIDDVPGFFFL